MTGRIALVNKPRFILIILVVFFIFSLTPIIYLLMKKGPKNPYSKGLGDKIIVLDAGHGGIDPGAHVGEYQEKDITIKVVREIEKILNKEKVTVILTRDEMGGIIPKDIMTLAAQEANLLERREFAQQQQASIFLSIHVNSFPSEDASGPIVYYQNKNQHYKALAENIQKEINKLYNKKWTAKEADFVVINKTEMPSILVEIGFISNSRDRNFLKSKNGQERIAKAIYQGLRNYAQQLGE